MLRERSKGRGEFFYFPELPMANAPHGLYIPSEEGFAAEIEKGGLVLDVLNNVWYFTPAFDISTG